ncbi:MAG: T9SS type A sorting domain-containing protein [Bacteroidota bacterium]
MKIYSPHANITIRIKVEDSNDPTKNVEVDHFLTVANAWETITWDFLNNSGATALNVANTYDKISVYFNYGQDGTTAGGARVYYWDNLRFGDGAKAQIDLPVTFEFPDSIDYTMTDFGGNVSSVGLDPAGGTNRVAVVNKPVGAQLWSGTSVGKPTGFATPVPFTSSAKTMSARIYSPLANINIRLKAEDSNDNTKYIETNSFLVTANAWTTLVFDFNNLVVGSPSFDPAVNYNLVSISFNYGVDGATAGNQTFYFDDLKFGDGALAQINLPVTFENSGVVDYTLTDFGNNSSVIGNDPLDPTNKVAVTTKPTTAQTWSGTTVGTTDGFASAVPFSAGNTKMNVRIYSPHANIQVRLKAEDSTDPSRSVETQTQLTTANAWETLTFDFDNEVGGTAAINFAYSYDKVSIFFNYGVDGATAGAKTYYWDEVRFGDAGKQQIDLPVSFEYPDSIDYVFTDFGNNSTVLGTDPTDPSNQVAITTKTAAAEIWAGTSLGDTDAFANPIPFTATNKLMNFRVYSPHAPILLRLKIEDSADPNKYVEVNKQLTVANAWETVTVDFTQGIVGSPAFDLNTDYDKFSIHFNYGTNGATAGAKTYYWDDVRFGDGEKKKVDLPVDFDSPDSIDYVFTDFGNNATVLGVDPTNPANGVAVTTKPVTAELWSGTSLGDFNGFVNPIPFTASEGRMNVRVYSPHAPILIRLKVEDSADPTKYVEVDQQLTVANAWTTMTFDFYAQNASSPALNLANTYDKYSIHFNYGTNGATAGAKTYYWDNVRFGDGSLQQVDLPVTFDDVTVDYSFNDFGNNSTTLGLDPLDGSNQVAVSTKPVTGEIWAGTTLGGFNGLANPIPFSAGNTKMTVRVFSPDAGIFIRLKAEDNNDPTKFVEVDVPVATANAWNILEFDFANPVATSPALNFATNYDKLSIHFNYGVAGATAGAKTYYWDDVEFGAAPSLTQIDLPITFEDASIDYSLTDFGNNVSTIVNDPVGGTNNVVKTTKPVSAEVWSGTTMSTPNGLATPIPFSASETGISVRVYSPDAGIPVRLKAEDKSDPTKSVETEVFTTVGNGWETLVFNFAGQVTGTQPLNLNTTYDLLSIFFNFGTNGATAGEKVYYWDDVIFVGFVPQPDMSLPITFEDTAVVNYVLSDFGGNVSSIGADPVGGANTVGITTKTAAAQLWAGTSMGGQNGMVNAVPFQQGATLMSLRIYSPAAGIPIRLKAENSADGSQTVETEATTTAANVWETLTFDFANPAAGTPAINFAHTYDILSIHFNFGTTGAVTGAQTFYWDDVKFVGAGSGLQQVDLPVDFEATNVDYSLDDFGGNISEITADPANASNTVVKSTKTNTAELWAGTTLGADGLASPIPITATATKMKVDVYSPDAGIPVRVKVENAADGTKSVETEATTTVANAWETLEFDFSNEAPGTLPLSLTTVYNKFSIFFNFNTTGSVAGTKDYYWDNVIFVDEPNSIDDLRKLGLRYYPNPVDQTLQVEAMERIDRLSVYNLMGQKLMEVSPRSLQSTLDLRSLVSGTYFVRAKVGEVEGSFTIIKR